MVQPAIAQQRPVLWSAEGVGAPSAGGLGAKPGEAPNVTARYVCVVSWVICPARSAASTTIFTLLEGAAALVVYVHT